MQPILQQPQHEAIAGTIPRGEAGQLEYIITRACHAVGCRNCGIEARVAHYLDVRRKVIYARTTVRIRERTDRYAEQIGQVIAACANFASRGRYLFACKNRVRHRVRADLHSVGCHLNDLRG